MLLHALSTISNLNQAPNLSMSLPIDYLIARGKYVVDEHVKDIKAQSVIQDLLSPWNSPIFLVSKKDGSFRPVIDFRRVNEVIEDEKYPLPVLKDLLMSLGQSNIIFSSLDLLSGSGRSRWLLNLEQ